MDKQAYDERYELYLYEIEKYLNALFEEQTHWADLYESMRYSILAGGKHYVDDAHLDVASMVRDLSHLHERSSTACPGPHDWESAFGDAENVFCIAITSTLSGSCNAARLAARDYEETHPGRRVHVIDTLSTGPEMRLVIEKLAELFAKEMPFDAIVEEITRYLRRTHLYFILQSVHNLVQNGRVGVAIGALVGLLGIRIVGKASDRGDLQTTAKCRGDRKALKEVVSSLHAEGWKGGKVRIDHCDNEPFAAALRDALLADFPAADITLHPARGLCSYYAEAGGIMLAFEDN